MALFLISFILHPVTWKFISVSHHKKSQNDTWRGREMLLGRCVAYRGLFICSPVPIQLMLGTHSLVRYKKSKSVRYMWILFILCHLDQRLINIMKTRLQSKGVEVLLSACCFDSSLLLRFPRFLHSHLRLDRLKRKERKRGKEVRVWKLRNEKSKCN